MGAPAELWQDPTAVGRWVTNVGAGGGRGAEGLSVVEGGVEAVGRGEEEDRKEEDVRPNFRTLIAPFNNCTHDCIIIITFKNRDLNQATVLTTMTTLHVVFRRRTSKSASRDHQSSIASGSVEFFR